jgi:hypothetical protein
VGAGGELPVTQSSRMSPQVYARICGALYLCIIVAELLTRGVDAPKWLEQMSTASSCS